MKKLSWRKALFDARKGTQLRLLHRFPNGNLVVANDDGNFAKTVDPYGYTLAPDHLRKRLVTNAPIQTVEYVSIYPNGGVYQRADGPVKTSSYGVENLIQIRVTKLGDQIVKKEFV